VKATDIPMDVNQPIEVVTDGVTCHRPAQLHRIVVTTKANALGQRDITERVFVGWYPACQPQPDPDAYTEPNRWHPQSAPYAIEQGAAVCPTCEEGNP